MTSQTGRSLKIVNWIANADLEIKNIWQDWNFLSSELNTPYSQTLTAGTSTYSKPADFGMWNLDSLVLDATADTYQPLQYIDYMDYKLNYSRGTLTNDLPTLFSVDRTGNLVLSPPPDSAYTLTGEYYILPAVMTADGDISPIPAQFHRIILLKAQMMYAAEDDAPEILETASAEFLVMLDQLEAHSLPDQGARRKARATGQEMIVSVPV